MYIIESTEQSKIRDEDCWYMRPEPNKPGLFYIENCGFEGQKMSMWDWWFLQPWTSFGVRGANRDDTMQFRLEPVGNYFRIRSNKFPKFRLGKRGIKDTDVEMTDGPDDESQLWKLVPRFET